MTGRYITAGFPLFLWHLLEYNNLPWLGIINTNEGGGKQIHIDLINTFMSWLWRPSVDMEIYEFKCTTDFFYQEENPFEKVFFIKDHPTMASIAVELGIFPSLTQARKNGWGYPTKLGKRTLTKRRIAIDVR